MREIIKSEALGRVLMINTWNYNDFMVRPYPDQELEMSRGVALNQGPHQVDIVRRSGSMSIYGAPLRSWTRAYSRRPSLESRLLG